MKLAAVIPMAFVMIAGPQIVTAIFLATTEKWLRNSLAFLVGVATATTLGVAIAYGVASILKSAAASAGSKSGAGWIDWVTVALLVFLMFKVFQRRKNTEPPAWMARLQSATPRQSFRVAFLLFLLMPTDIVSMTTVGATLARNHQPLSDGLIFLFATLLLAGTPMFIDILLGKRATTVLPSLRKWMSANAWIVSEAVVVFFLAMTINGMVTG